MAACPRQAIGEDAGLRGLAAAFATLECYEPAGFDHFVPHVLSL
jgi:hypothetical protein